MFLCLLSTSLQGDCSSRCYEQLCNCPREVGLCPSDYVTSHFSFFPQPNDFSISLKAQSKNKHFKVQLKETLYCIGQRKFNSMEELVEHYKKAPIFTSEQGDKLYLIKALAAS